MTSTNTTISPLLLINQRTYKAQIRPAIFISDGGEFAVVWHSRIYGEKIEFEARTRSFDAWGRPTSDEFNFPSVHIQSFGIPTVKQIDSRHFVYATINDGVDPANYYFLNNNLKIESQLKDGYKGGVADFEVLDGRIIVNSEEIIDKSSRIEVSVYDKSGRLNDSLVVYDTAGTTKGLYYPKISTFSVGRAVYSYAIEIGEDKIFGNNVLLDRYFMVNKCVIGGDGKIASSTNFKFDPKGYKAADLAENTGTVLKFTPLHNGLLAVTWTQTAEYKSKSVESVFTQLYDKSFKPIGQPTALSDLDAGIAPGAYRGEIFAIKTIPLRDGGYAAVWTGPTDASSEFEQTFSSYLRIVNADGKPRSTVITLNNSTVWNCDIVQKTDGKIVVAWDSFRTEDDQDNDLTAISAIIVDPRTGKLFAQGTKANDVVRGTIYGDILNGVDGNDRIFGGLGNDSLTGGKGADSFVFDTAFVADANVDRITDFNHKDDTFRIENGVFKGTGAKGWLPKDAFHIGTHAGDREDRIIYDKERGNLYHDRDGSGSRYDLVKFAEVTKGIAIDYSDFLVI